MIGKPALLKLAYFTLVLILFCAIRQEFFEQETLHDEVKEATVTFEESCAVDDEECVENAENNRHDSMYGPEDNEENGSIGNNNQETPARKFRWLFFIPPYGFTVGVFYVVFRLQEEMKEEPYSERAGRVGMKPKQPRRKQKGAFTGDASMENIHQATNKEPNKEKCPPIPEEDPEISPDPTRESARALWRACLQLDSLTDPSTIGDDKSETMRAVDALVKERRGPLRFEDRSDDEQVLAHRDAAMAFVSSMMTKDNTEEQRDSLKKDTVDDITFDKTNDIIDGKATSEVPLAEGIHQRSCQAQDTAL